MSNGSIAEELARDLGFGQADAQHLLASAAEMEPRLGRVVDRFYEIIVANPRTRDVFEDEAQIERQKEHLLGWLRGLFGGVYDEGYWAVRERIGRTHVRIGLNQRYMVSMMGVVRTELERTLADVAADGRWSAEREAATRAAVDKLLDLELAVMLETYQEASLRRVRSGERLATVGQIAASIGHELRNPLAVIDSSLMLVRRRAPDDERVTKHLDRIGAQVKVADAIITNLLAMVRDQPPTRARVDLEAVARDAWSSLLVREAHLELDLAVREARLDPAHLRQLLVNLFQNALQAGAENITLTGRAEGSALELAVSDDGAGLPTGAEDWLFEPLATARRGGSGLGLALCQRIVQKHAGSIAAERLETGTRFVARFGAAVPAPPEEGP